MNVASVPARPAKPWLSDEYRTDLDSPAWRATRAAALDRAGRRCAACGETARLEVHHRHDRTLGSEAWGDPAVLCHRCHLDADRRRTGIGR